MATSAVIQFYYSDDVHLSTIFKRYDAFPQDVLQTLKTSLKETKNRGWGFIVAELISKFVLESCNSRGVKMLQGAPDEDAYFEYFYKVYPKDELFEDDTIPLKSSIYVDIWSGNKKKLLYSGSIGCFTNTKL